MQTLNKQTYPAGRRFDHLPEKIVQFGEGNFLRGFLDWMIQRMNEQELFLGRVVAIQPTPHGKVVPKLLAQDGLYTVALRGFANGEQVDRTEVVAAISRGINPYADWLEVLRLAENRQIEFVFSNTTEAGLSYFQEEYAANRAPLSFPGKLTAFLFHRFQATAGDPTAGLKIFPCELLENNGDLLKAIVMQLAKDWRLPDAFTEWLQSHNRFFNTLVDRIVIGYPKENSEEYEQRLGYRDELLTVGEPYHFFAIEGDETTAAALPFRQAGLNVFWGDVKPFRELKVRILNGAHTMMFAVAYLSGVDTVLQAMEDQQLRRFIQRGMEQEILPYIALEQAVKTNFARSVEERFLNPFNRHQLLDLALNAVTKYKLRVLPSLLDAVKTGTLPAVLCFSLAGLMLFYRGIQRDGQQLVGMREQQPYSIRDQEEVLQFFQNVWSACQGEKEQVQQLVRAVLGNESFWGENLLQIAGLEEKVGQYLRQMLHDGMRAALTRLLEGDGA
ncbi:tagaturonate reductase [Brevibacillus fulvus]|uniref:Tagaturonate reductase n=1 Tax=Brevibacillus fulvus TaxID=1125967 RepID=A0A939BT90_9BACL|nr:tagaturonate reductase [Brevibacillus fulvus]MBM7589234.1 tagaturonate reductase [Brevibacillus fulvus]